MNTKYIPKYLSKRFLRIENEKEARKEEERLVTLNGFHC